MPEIEDAVQAGSVVKPLNRFSDDDLRSMMDFQSAIDALHESGAVVEDYSEAYGNGFRILPTGDKDRLINMDMIIVEWRFSEGDNGEFVSAMVVTESGERWVVNDGSTGIRDQLRKVSDIRLGKGASDDQAFKGLRVKGGLRRSDYTYQDDKGQSRPASTYYLAV